VSALIRNEQVYFGLVLPFPDFPALVDAHIKAFPRTPAIEASGQQLCEAGFPEAALRSFVKEVCSWGNYPGIAGRVLKRNSLPEIRTVLGNAVAELDGDTPRYGAALHWVNTLNGLGGPSFASKHLRFLRPQHCPVFDSLLREGLPYSFDSEGYAQFAADCKVLADALRHAGVRNPRNRPDGVWFAADVEAALYAHVTGLMDDG
jgi:hypothetical protein